MLLRAEEEVYTPRDFTHPVNEGSATKFLFTLVYLVLAGVEFWLGNRLMKLETEQIRGTKSGSGSPFLLPVGMLLVSFAEFWALTRIFPFHLVLILIGALALGNFLYFVTGSITGFTLAEKQQKMGALSVIWGASQPMPACIAVALILLARLIGIIGVLWAFWTHPVGDPRAIVLIAFFHFVVVQALAIPGLIVMQWPMVTSEFLDDDIRNSYLAQQFSRIIYSTIYLLFPLWLFKQDIRLAFPSIHLPATDLPHFWILLSIPLLLFLGGGVFPFFLGINRYRAQVKAMSAWLEGWLQQVLITNTLPLGDLRSRQLQDQLEDLGDEITRRISENQLLHFYLTTGQAAELNLSTAANPSQPALEVSNPTASSQADNPAAEVGSAAVTPQAGGPAAEVGGAAVTPQAGNPALANFAEQARAALLYVRGRAAQPESPEATANLADVIRKNRKNLVYWDFRFYYLGRLLELGENVPQADKNDMKAFLEASLQEIDQRVSSANIKSNILGGSFLTIMSSLGVWLFKNFQNDILAYIRHLVT